MQKSYVDNYASHFNLKKSGSIFLNERYEHVMSIINDKVYYRVNESEWKTCSAGDLLVSLINNIPLHIS